MKRHTVHCLRACICLAMFACLGLASSASAATFSNSSPITITDSSAATPYPSSIAVSGLTGTIIDVNVTISGYNHTFPDDVGVVLVAPSGAALLLMDGVGDTPDAVNETLTFDDAAAGTLPDKTEPITGTYKPTTYYSGDNFLAPGPGTTYGNPGPAGGGTATFASIFNGTAPNGTWNLFVRDFVGGDTGSISGGWSITVTTNTSPPSAPTLKATTPASPANNNNPKILGTASAGTTISLYASASCSGAAVATGTAAALESPGLAATVADNTITQFSATAKNINGPSTCSVPLTYVESTPGSLGRSAPLVPPALETTIAKAKIKGAKGKAKFTFSGAGGSGVLSFECKLDKHAFAPCTSPKKYKGLAAGKHKFQVRAKDGTGSVDAAPATKKFTIPKPD